MKANRNAQRGFAAVAAIFLLVVLAALGAFMVSISSSQQINAAQDVRGTRAFWAARGGLEWAMGSLSAAPTVCPVPPAPFTLDGFTLAVTCSAASFDEAGVTRRIFSVTSRASAGTGAGSVGFVERSVSASVEF